MTAAMRVRYLSGSSSIADDQRQQWASSSCGGSPIQRYANHTLTSSSAGAVETDTRLATANSWSWTITGRTAGGSIHMQFELSAKGDFTDGAIVFDQLVTYATGVATQVCLAWGIAPAGPCAYGTRSKAGVAVQEYLSEPLVLAILSAVGASPLAPALAGFFGGVYLIEDVCSRPPPPVPPVDLNIWHASAETLKQLLDAAAWPFYCECVPGTPAPIPEPPPVIVVPPGLAQPPAVACDPLDFCASLIAILEQQGRLQQVVGELYQLVTTMQRNGLPFAYLKGRTLPRVSGSGSAGLNRIVGLSIVVQERPVAPRTFTGTPPYLSDLGWISALTPDGLLDEIRLTRDHTSWFSKLLPTATLVGWGLRDGVAVDITELVAEH